MLSKESPSPVIRTRDGILDLVRGLSALLVMLGHLRGFVFEDFGDLKNVGIFTRIFYFATGLGHQAVMVFFVLSGYFVGGSVLNAIRNNCFAWDRYSLARLARLWVVLVPALLFTLAIDKLGSSYCPGAYSGEFHGQFMSGPSLIAPASYGWTTFLANLGFVQSIASPVFGSNGPLWSLSNEFWYYVLFPLAATMRFPVRVGRPKPVLLLANAFKFALSVVLLWCLPKGLLLFGLVWILGVGVWWVSEWRGVMALTQNWMWRIACGGLFIASLGFSKTGGWMGSDCAVGITFALWLPSLLGTWPRRGWWTSLATGLSEFSFTLYVIHFPLLFFASAVILKGQQFPPNAYGLLLFAGLALVTVIFSALMWWLFERNTDFLRRMVQRRFEEQIGVEVGP